jgi:hypothetical protein
MARTQTTTNTTKPNTQLRPKGDNGGNGQTVATPAKRQGWRQVTNDERHQMIQFAAYMKAEKRGFKNGDPTQDWVNAEKEVDAWLKSQQQASHN